MTLLKRRSDTVPLSFRVPKDLHCRLKKVCKEAKDLGLFFNWQNLLIKSLETYLKQAEKEIKEAKLSHEGVNVKN